jgi:hypothetical protein
MRLNTVFGSVQANSHDQAALEGPEPRLAAHAANTCSNADRSDATQVATPLAHPAAGQRPSHTRRQRRAATVGIRRALEEEADGSGVAGSGAAAYTTSMQRAARWHQEDDDYHASPAQAFTNAQRALKASGYNAHAWQTRQIIAAGHNRQYKQPQGPEDKARQGRTTQVYSETIPG